MLFKHYCLSIFLLFPFTTIFSQQETQYAFTHFSKTNGLVANSVFNIIQDKRGYIWLATVDGLQRYDGNRFITFRHISSDEHSIPGDYITQITEDKDGNLWLSAGGKTGFFNTKDFSFTAVPIEGEDPSQPYIIRFLGRAANGYIALYAEQKGFFIYDPVSKIFKTEIAFQLKEKQRLFEIQSIDSGRGYWMGVYGGLLLYDTKTGNLNYRGHNPDDNKILNYLKEDTVITRLYGYQNNNVWYGSWPPVAYGPFINILNLKSGEKKSYSISKQFNFGYVEIGGALFQQNGRIWFYGRSFIAEYTGNDKAPFQLIANEYTGEQSISFDGVSNMMEDNQHNIWIATDNGVFVFNPDIQPFSNYKLKRGPGKEGSYAPVSGVCELKNGNLLFTTWGAGLFYYDNNINALQLPPELKEFTRSYAMWCVHEHSKTGLLWMGMQHGELTVYDPVKKTFEILHEKAFNRSTIRQITEDAYGNLWFGLQSGSIVKWNMKDAGNDIHKGYTIVKEKGGGYIHKMYTAKDGSVWACFLTDGLYRYNAATNEIIHHYTKDNLNDKGLWTNSVYDVYEYNDSIMLIADDALDILNTKTNKITHISTENGLPSNTVLSVEADKEGILWLGMANQLCRYDLQKKIFSIFDRRDGISNDLFNAAGDYKMRDGRFIYMTDKNFIALKPETVATAPVPGKVVITGFKLGNKSLQVDSLNRFNTIELKYNNTSVSIEFNALNYTPQNKLHYHYMLDGIDKEWQPATALNEAIYNYLPDGDFTFKVKAENTEGDQSNITQMYIHVVPPVWKSWWFLGLLILLVLAIFYLVDSERIKKLQALQKVRTQIAQNLHSEVNTTLNHINLLGEMAKIKADKDIERSKEYIEQISDKSRSMIDSMDDMLWTLNPHNDSMEKTILRMKEYAEAIQNSFLIRVQMEADGKVNSLKTDMKLRHEIFLIFKKTLRTIAEKADNSICIINIDYAAKKLLLKIQNNEVTFEGTEAEQTLTEILARAEVIKAELDIQNDSKGISLILLVPLA
jgi:ligand-binding sensor domain-containing protein/signal transduction histidine kinase